MAERRSGFWFGKELPFLLAWMRAGLVCRACLVNGRWNFARVSVLGAGKDNFLPVVLQQSASFEQIAFWFSCVEIVFHSPSCLQMEHWTLAAITLLLALIPVFHGLFSVWFASEEGGLALLHSCVSKSFFEDLSLSPWAHGSQRDNLGCT